VTWISWYLPDLHSPCAVTSERYSKITKLARAEVLLDALNISIGERALTDSAFNLSSASEKERIARRFVELHAAVGTASPAGEIRCDARASDARSIG
jgi:hypothetical protein